MSWRDDFVEALRSVKRDFIKDYDGPAEQSSRQQSEPPAHPVEPAAHSAEPAVPAPPPEQPPQQPSYGGYMAAQQSEPTRSEHWDEQDSQPQTAPPEPIRQEPVASASEPEVEKPADSTEPPPAADTPSVDMNSFVQITSEGDTGVFDDDIDLDDEELEPDIDPTPYRVPDPEPVYSVEPTDRRYIFDDADVSDDGERTVISKNTVIRGALQTEDSIQLYGQILGDIECKSNIMVAGKVRGNTSAANAYVMNAQVDGNLLCDDVINVTDDAWILGNIRAQQADIDGKVKGNIEIRNSISIGSNSSVIGNISTDELEIKRGAFINGQIMMYSPSRDVIDKFDRFEQP